MNEPLRLILDVDTGVDDALAIALAVRHPRVQLDAVLTVVGNVSLELTTRLLERLISAARRTRRPFEVAEEQMRFIVEQWSFKAGGLP